MKVKHRLHRIATDLETFNEEPTAVGSPSPYERWLRRQVDACLPWFAIWR